MLQLDSAVNFCGHWLKSLPFKVVATHLSDTLQQLWIIALSPQEGGRLPDGLDLARLHHGSMCDHCGINLQVDKKMWAA